MLDWPFREEETLGRECMTKLFYTISWCVTFLSFFSVYCWAWQDCDLYTGYLLVWGQYRLISPFSSAHFRRENLVDFIFRQANSEKPEVFSSVGNHFSSYHSWSKFQLRLKRNCGRSELQINTAFRCSSPQLGSTLAYAHIKCVSLKQVIVKSYVWTGLWCRPWPDALIFHVMSRLGAIMSIVDHNTKNCAFTTYLAFISYFSLFLEYE